VRGGRAAFSLKEFGVCIKFSWHANSLLDATELVERKWPSDGSAAERGYELSPFDVSQLPIDARSCHEAGENIMPLRRGPDPTRYVLSKWKWHIGDMAIAPVASLGQLTAGIATRDREPTQFGQQFLGHLS
jgi:hypothetical protein